MSNDHDGIAARPLPEDQWRAERCGHDHVVVSVSEANGYRHFVRLPLNPDAGKDDA